MKKIPITVIMLSLNEEFHIGDAIDNVKDWAEEIFIVDSLSTDKTVDIALEKGVTVVQRPFTNFGDQWNFALENLPIKTPWTFKLDPDERLSEKLKNEIADVINNSPEYTAYSMNWHFWFMGKPLHVSAPVMRLWQTGKCRFSDVIVNEHPLINGNIGKLNGVLEHYDSRDLHHWMEKQNRYTTMLAIQKIKNQQLSAKPNLFGSTLERRMFFITIFFKLPFRYYLQWFYEMFIRGAWRDGRHGMIYTKMCIETRRMRELKYKELKLTGRIPQIPKAPHGDYDKRILNTELQEKIMKWEGHAEDAKCLGEKE